MELVSEPLSNQSNVLQDIITHLKLNGQSSLTSHHSQAEVREYLISHPTLMNVSDFMNMGLSVDQALDGIFPQVKLDIRRTPCMLESFGTNTNLVTLSLRANYIEDLGAKIMGGVLKNNKNLTTLNLDYNLITAAGMKDLAEGLAQNATLTTLTLDYNKIGDEGVGYLAEVLKNNQTLTSLGLEFTMITDKGVACLVDALSENTSVVNLNLCDNFISAQGTRLLNGVMKERKVPIALNLNENYIEIELDGKDDIKKIAKRIDGASKTHKCHSGIDYGKNIETENDLQQLRVSTLLETRLRILSNLKKLHDQLFPCKGKYMHYKNELTCNEICLWHNLEKKELDCIFNRSNKREIITTGHVINVALALKKRIPEDTLKLKTLDNNIEKLKKYETEIVYILGDDTFLTSVSEIDSSDSEVRELALKEPIYLIKQSDSCECNLF